jgi:hypothetical protein
MSDPTLDPEAVRALLDRIAATHAAGRFSDAQSNGQFGDADGGHGYDPNQPRVPAGHSDGGQWTNKAGGRPTAFRREAIVDRTGKEAWGSVANAYRGDGTLAEQRVFNRDGSRIVSQFNDGSAGGWDERHTVVMPDHSKVTFENSGEVQRVYDGDGRPISASVWEDDGPETVPKAQLAFLQVLGGAAAGAAAHFAGRVVVQKGIEAALLLLTWLSSRNGADRTAVMSFPAYVYERANTETGAGANTEPFVRVDELTDEQLGKICEKYGKVQEFTDVAAEKARAEGKRWSPQSFGTSVHARVACEVNGMTNDGTKCRSPSDPENPNFLAELSAVKAKAEEQNASLPERDAALPNPDAKPRYGGTIRVDVLEKASEDMVCVYDIKTGNAGLTLARIKEIIGSVFKHFKSINKIVIAQVRPRL